MKSNRGMYWYLAALLLWWGGAFLAARSYPAGFDWQYTVMSALASRKHNPAGYMWFAAGLSLSMLLLWPYVTALGQRLRAMLAPGAGPGLALTAFRIGIVCAALLGVERLTIYDLSRLLYKGHEVIALFAFLGLYGGVFGLLVQLARRQQAFVVPVLLVASPLLAIGLNQLWLYLAQRDLGWVDTSWRAMGIPVWHSFAFWQWLAIVFLWAGAGLLGWAARRTQPGASQQAAGDDG